MTDLALMPSVSLPSLKGGVEDDVVAVVVRDIYKKTQGKKAFAKEENHDDKGRDRVILYDVHLVADYSD